MLTLDSFSSVVGHRIKKYRKSRGYTIEKFSAKLNKSKATISKYENGVIPVDLETLYEISRVLNIDIKYFVDYPIPIFYDESKEQEDSHFFQSLAYMYYYDGNIRQMVRSLLQFSSSIENNSSKVALYLGVTSFDNPDSCQHLFAGKMKLYDTVTYMVLNNQINVQEKMFICMLNPMQNHAPAIGILSSVGSTPFFAPSALKVLISNKPLEDSNRLLTTVRLSKDENHRLRSYNMMVVNRSLSLLF